MFIVTMVVSKLGGQIDRIYNRPIICLVSIYLGYTIYIFTERDIIEVRHFVNIIMKLAYVQHIIIRYNIYIYNNVQSVI